ncbi:hypothetical protein PNH38_11470 [Anoxybacillus rupiensis]|uniref:Uncharacterized protein n=1 Tax=Anoxybacteroides rupiense TaxID=311460 RepID=A0ABT5W5B3_9BACL|nr:hypothetical protein [Anoxybacillus rupiensis]
MGRIWAKARSGSLGIAHKELHHHGTGHQVPYLNGWDRPHANRQAVDRRHQRETEKASMLPKQAVRTASEC